MPAKRWTARLGTFQAATVLANATLRDLEHVEAFQQEAFATIGLQIGRFQEVTGHTCPDCGQCFRTLQGMRRHQVTKHGGMHVANICATGTSCPFCLKDYHVRYKVVQHLKQNTRCLTYARLFKPLGYAREPEAAKGAELASLTARKPTRLSGPKPW